VKFRAGDFQNHDTGGATWCTSGSVAPGTLSSHSSRASATVRNAPEGDLRRWPADYRGWVGYRADVVRSGLYPWLYPPAGTDGAPIGACVCGRPAAELAPARDRSGTEEGQHASGEAKSALVRRGNSARGALYLEAGVFKHRVTRGRSRCR